jgi:hypothetical protein
MVPAVMTPGRSVIPSAGDCRWRSRSLLRAVLLGNFAIDAVLVLAIIAWASA